MTAAERKRKQRAKAQADVTEKKKQAYKQKENQRRSRLRRVQIAKMSDKERSNFHATNPCKSRQSFRKALNRCRTELPESPQKHTAVASS